MRKRAWWPAALFFVGGLNAATLSCKDAPTLATAASQERPDAAPSCADAWLAQHGLNEFGDPPGTMYAGGTPLFDEKTGKRTGRAELLRAKLPQLARDCPR